MKTFKEFLAEAGQQFERQENGFVAAINEAVEANDGNPITLISKHDKIKGVLKAEKFQGRQQSGNEPYTDIQLITASGLVNLSMKGPTAPSLAGGGLRGIEAIIPGLSARFFRAVYDWHMKNKLKPGDKVPDAYGILSKKDKELLVIGNKAMGGPIDFMYIGPMDVKSTLKENVLNINGNLIKAKEYSDSKDLYFRLRARRADQPFDPTASDKNGVPKIYGKSPTKKDTAGRLVITDKKVKARELIKF
jgi:hypothetical protein